MLRYVLFETTLFANGSQREQAEKDLCWMLEALTQRNQQYLVEHPDTPLLYESGVVYARPAQMTGDCYEVAVLKKALAGRSYSGEVADVLEKVGRVLGGERFCDIGVILERGSIDCDGLACFRAAELRQRGIKARAWIKGRRRLDGGMTYHAMVLWPDGSWEDPSLLLGMGGKDREADRKEEIRKNQERVDMALAAANRGHGDDSLFNKVMSDVSVNGHWEDA